MTFPYPCGIHVLGGMTKRCHLCEMAMLLTLSEIAHGRPVSTITKALTMDVKDRHRPEGKKHGQSSAEVEDLEGRS